MPEFAGLVALLGLAPISLPVLVPVVPVVDCGVVPVVDWFDMSVPEVLGVVDVLGVVEVDCELVDDCWSLGFVPVVLVAPCVPVVLWSVAVPVDCVPIVLDGVWSVLLGVLLVVLPVCAFGSVDVVVPVCATAMPVDSSVTAVK